MIPKNLPSLPLIGNTGLTVNQITRKEVMSDLDLIAADIEKTTAKKTIREAGGVRIGHRWVIGTDKFLAYLDAKGKTLAPAPKTTKKTAPVRKMTPDEIAEAAGLSVVKGGAK